MGSYQLSNKVVLVTGGTGGLGSATAQALLARGAQVAIVDVTNGARLETYVIEGDRGSGIVGINGAAAHLIHPGDLVILISYAQMDDGLARRYQPRVVHVDGANHIVDLGDDLAAPVPGGAGLLRGDVVTAAV